MLRVLGCSHRAECGQSVNPVGDTICIGDGEAVLQLLPREVEIFLSDLARCGLLTEAPVDEVPVTVSKCEGFGTVEVTAFSQGTEIVWRYRVCEPDGRRSAEGEIRIDGPDGYLVTIARMFIVTRGSLHKDMQELGRRFETSESVRSLCVRDPTYAALIINKMSQALAA